MTGFLFMALAGLGLALFSGLLLYLLKQSNKQRDEYFYKLIEERRIVKELELKLRGKKC